MEPYANNLPIGELIAKLDAYMVELGYTPSTLRHHRQAWNALKNLALTEGATYFTKELGFELLREHYHVDPYTPKLSEYKSVVRRSVMLLLEFQISGTIAKRTPKSEYIFPEGFRIAGEAYLSMLQSEGQIRESTLRNHRHRLVAAALFFESHRVTGIDFVNTEIINLYLKTLAGCSQSYLSGVLRTLKHFFEFSAEQGYLSASFTFPSVSVYKDRKIPEYYLPEEISRILSAVDRGNSLGKRNYAMILLAARYGLRIGDIRTLKLTDVDFSMNQIHIIQQKTSKPLTLDLLPDVGWALIDYLKFGRPQVSAAEIFLRHVHPYGPLGDSDNMGYVIRQYAVAAGIRKNAKKVHHSFHMLRYTVKNENGWTVYTYTLNATSLQSDLSFTAHINAMDRDVDFTISLDLANATKTGDTIEDLGERPAEFVPVFTIEGEGNYQVSVGSVFAFPEASAILGSEECAVTVSAYYLRDGVEEPVEIKDNRFTVSEIGEYHLIYTGYFNCFRV